MQRIMYNKYVRCVYVCTAEVDATPNFFKTVKLGILYCVCCAILVVQWTTEMQGLDQGQCCRQFPYNMSFPISQTHTHKHTRVYYLYNYMIYSNRPTICISINVYITCITITRVWMHRYYLISQLFLLKRKKNRMYKIKCGTRYDKRIMLNIKL